MTISIAETVHDLSDKRFAETGSCNARQVRTDLDMPIGPPAHGKSQEQSQSGFCNGVFMTTKAEAEQKNNGTYNDAELKTESMCDTTSDDYNEVLFSFEQGNQCDGEKKDFNEEIIMPHSNENDFDDFEGILLLFGEQVDKANKLNHIEKDELKHRDTYRRRLQDFRASRTLDQKHSSLPIETHNYSDQKETQHFPIRPRKLSISLRNTHKPYSHLHRVIFDTFD